MFSYLFVTLWLAAIVVEEEPEPAQVLVLGTFHMSAEKDPLNPVVEDVLGPERQAQFGDLMERLAAFQPNKIALEAEPDSPVVGAEYTQFLEGELDADADERQQVGYRLAEQLGHEQVYGVDEYRPLDVQGLLSWAHSNGQGQLAGELQGAYVRATARWTQEYMDEHSLLEIYEAFNTSEVDHEIHQVFFSGLSIGSAKEPMGATMVSSWYERNIRITANILRLARPGDRILVLFGANHRKLLIEMLRQTRGIEVVDTAEVLRKP